MCGHARHVYQLCGCAVVQDKFTSYVETLCAEIGLQARLNKTPLSSVYFGGGTPSLLPPTHLHRIMEQLQASFGIDATAEITMEADPGTFDADRLRQFMAAGVTRFSVGVQAFDEVRCVFVMAHNQPNHTPTLLPNRRNRIVVLNSF